jgi:hypothetical protein
MEASLLEVRAMGKDAGLQEANRKTWADWRHRYQSCSEVSPKNEQLD